jgi:hypothetical protein
MGNWDYGQSVLKGYLARQELDQRNQQLFLEHKQAQDMLKMHYKALDDAANQHKEKIDLERGKLREDAMTHYNLIYGSLDQAPASAQYPGVQTQISQQPQQSQDLSQDSILPGVQHQLAGIGGAIPWQMNPPSLEGTGVGPITIDPNYQQKFKQLGLLQADIAGAKKKAETQGEYDVRGPIEQERADTLAQNRRDLQSDKDQAAMDRLEKGIASKEDIARLGRETQRSIAAGHDAVRREVLKAKGSDQDIQDSLGAFDQAVTGQRKLTSGKGDKTAANAIAKLGWINMDPKNAQAMNGATSIENMADRAQEFVDNMSSNPGENWLNSTIVGAQSSDPKARAFNKAADQVESERMAFARMQAETSQRLNLPEYVSASKGLPLKKDTPEIAQQKVDDIRSNAWKIQWNNAMGGMTTDQKLYKLQRQNGGLTGLINRYEGKKITNPHYNESGVDPKLAAQKTIPIIGFDKKNNTYKIWNPTSKKYLDLNEVQNPLKQQMQASPEPEEEEEE